ncbi:hypothetical protein EMIT0111MI5_10528 [Burkholderia sp. IT-111MI5]
MGRRRGASRARRRALLPDQEGGPVAPGNPCGCAAAPAPRCARHRVAILHADGEQLRTVAVTVTEDFTCGQCVARDEFAHLLQHHIAFAAPCRLDALIEFCKLGLQFLDLLHASVIPWLI